VGARPQFIKAGFMNKALQQKGVEEIGVDSGQHYDFKMSDIFFKRWISKHRIIVSVLVLEVMEK
jgi:UDP-N-acetylglucosamine 2-epimerase